MPGLHLVVMIHWPNGLKVPGHEQTRSLVSNAVAMSLTFAAIGRGSHADLITFVSVILHRSGA